MNSARFAGFLVGALPIPSVGWAIDGANAKAVVGSVATGIAADGDAVAWLERVLLNSLTAELPGSTPFGGPGDGLVFLSGNFQENRGMRISEEELDDRAFDGDCFGRVGSREGMVRMGMTREEEGGGEQEGPECEFCALRHLGNDTPREDFVIRSCGRLESKPLRLKPRLILANVARLKSCGKVVSFLRGVGYWTS